MQHFVKQFQNAVVEEYPNNVKINPLVSVCVQTYQHASFIKQCLESIVLQQTSFDFEILIGEDASTDGTRAICLDYAKKNPDRVRLFLHSRENVIYINGQPSGRFNMLYNIEKANGKYLAFCEGDDYWTDPLKLQKQIDFLEINHDFSMSISSRIVINEKGKKIKEQINEIDEWSILEVVNGFIPFTQTIVARNLPGLKDFFLSHLSHIGGDRLFTYFCSLHGKIKSFKEIMAAYRDHGKGAWTKYGKEEKMIMGLDSLLSFHKIIGLPANNWAFRKQISNMHVALLSELFSNPKYVIKSYIIFRKRYNLPIWLYFYSIFIFLKRLTKKIVKTILGME